MGRGESYWANSLVEVKESVVLIGGCVYFPRNPVNLTVLRSLY